MRAFAFLRQMVDYGGEGQLTDRKGWFAADPCPGAPGAQTLGVPALNPHIPRE